MKRNKGLLHRLTALILMAVLIFSVGCTASAGKKKKSNSSSGTSTQTEAAYSTDEKNSSGNGSGKSSGTDGITVEEDGEYTSKEEVALYLHTYGHLPGNFITKRQVQDLGWEGGSLAYYAPGKSIGGGKFGNYEGILPKKDGRTYYECDIDYDGGKRGAKRIVWSDDGLIYYTEDHYNTFEKLY